MGSKVVTTLYLLHACQYPPDTIIVFSDTDVLIQGRAAQNCCLWKSKKGNMGALPEGMSQADACA